MKKLEEQHQEQKLILEEQKKILQELKQHKESHEELKRIELIKKQEIKNDIQLSTASVMKQDKIMDMPHIVEAEVIKNVPPVFENVHKVDKISQNEILLNKNYVSESPGTSKNISFDNISKQKASEILLEMREKNRIEDLDVKENIVPKKVIHTEKVNKSNDIKLDTSFLNKNVTSNTISKDKPIISNIPSFDKKVTNQFNVPEDIKSSEMRVKRRETLAKKNDFEGTVSLPKSSIDINEILHNSDQRRT